MIGWLIDWWCWQWEFIWCWFQPETSSASTPGWRSTWCWRRTAPRWMTRNTFRSAFDQEENFLIITVLLTHSQKVSASNLSCLKCNAKRNGKITDPGEEHDADVTAEGGHLVTRRPPLHVSNIHVSTLNASTLKYGHNMSAPHDMVWTILPYMACTNVLASYNINLCIFDQLSAPPACENNIHISTLCHPWEKFLLAQSTWLWASNFIWPSTPKMWATPAMDFYHPNKLPNFPNCLTFKNAQIQTIKSTLLSKLLDFNFVKFIPSSDMWNMIGRGQFKFWPQLCMFK